MAIHTTVLHIVIITITIIHLIDCTRKDAVAARLYWLPLQAGLVAFHAPPAESRHGMIGIGSI